jgi:hypothetical protein
MDFKAGILVLLEDMMEIWLLVFIRDSGITWKFLVYLPSSVYEVQVSQSFIRSKWATDIRCIGFDRI